MNDFVVSERFPSPEYDDFGRFASASFPSLLSTEAMEDPHEKVRQFQWAWQAVRYRFRGCVEASAEFKAQLTNPGESWDAGWGDEELPYKIECCLYNFFGRALSVFDSFAYCLYFYGHALQPSAFPHVANSRKITRSVTAQAYVIAFPGAQLSSLLMKLSNEPEFRTIETVRNLVSHRLSGRRSVRFPSLLNQDDSYTHSRNETWHIPGLSQPLAFDKGMLDRQLDDMTALRQALFVAAREFAEQHQPAAA